MTRSVKLTRRKFMQIAAAAAAAGPIVSCTGAGRSWRFFSDPEARTLAAICERIIPADQDPGAAWAGVINYIDRQLTGRFKNLKRVYREGIAGVDQSSRSLFGRGFAELSAEHQDRVLAAIETDRAPGEAWKGLSSKQFFDLVVAHTMQGFYGDPRHGGNRERVSWKMLGLPYPPIRGLYDLPKPTTSQVSPSGGQE